MLHVVPFDKHQHPRQTQSVTDELAHDATRNSTSNVEAIHESVQLRTRRVRLD
jgi:hypothetical protein